MKAVFARKPFNFDIREVDIPKPGEGEVLVKIGKPDSESFDTGGGATTTVKRWIYLPTPRDQQTMTTVVLQNGKVIEVERKVVK